VDATDYFRIKKKRHKILAGVLPGLLGLFLSGLLFVNTKYLPATFLSKKILNNSHLLLFAVLGCIILRLVNFNSGAVSEWPRRNYLKSILLGSGFALLSEWLQQFVGREFEVRDILLNLAGILLIHGGCYLWAIRRDFSKVSLTFKTLFFTGSVALMGLLLWDLAVTLQHYFYLERQLPAITSFEEEWEFFRWELNDSTRAKIVPDPASPGRRCLKVDCRRGAYPGVALEYPPQNWQPYQALSFSVWHPESEPLALNVRIDDQPDGMPNRNMVYFEFEIKSGRNNIRIPFQEIRARAVKSAFDFSNVRRVIFFLERPDRRRVFYLDDLRLVE
jgi:hypothetical protein